MFVEHKEQGEVTEAPAKVLKLSEAMRIGMTLRPPVKDTTLYFDSCGSCALGAAYHAITGEVIEGQQGAARAVVSLFTGKMGIPMNVLIDVASKFNAHMPRARIADELESQGY